MDLYGDMLSNELCIDERIFLNAKENRSMKENYTQVNINEWSRGNLFKSYMDNMRIVMSLTVDIDVTNLITFIKNNHLKFYPSMIWIVSKVVNAHDEFKYSWDNDRNLINGILFPRLMLIFIRKMRISQNLLPYFLTTYLNFTIVLWLIKNKTSSDVPLSKISRETFLMFLVFRG